MLSGEFAGEWWLPDRPDRRWGGFLKLEAGKQPRLHLAGSVSDLQSRLSSVVVHHDLILGTTATGKQITLMRGSETGGQVALFTAGSGDTVIEAPVAYVGNHFEHATDAKFRRLDITLTFMDSWFPPPLIEQELNVPGGLLRKGALTFQTHSPVEVRTDFGVLRFGHDLSISGDHRVEARITQEASVVAMTDRQQPLDWWLATVVKPLRHLLALSTERSISIETIRLRPWKTKHEGEVEVVWANDMPDDRSRQIRQQEMLIWYGDLADRFEPTLRRWFASVRELEEILDQLVATYHESRSFVETRFTMTVGAAEAYHRVRIGGTDAPEAIHQERVTQARDGVTSAHLEWLNPRLSNEPALLQRLTELCDEVPEVAKLVVGDDHLAFARQVRDARNLRTHLDFRNRASPASLRLVALTAQLAVILEAAILVRELGFEDHDVAQRMERGSRLLHIAGAAARQAKP